MERSALDTEFAEIYQALLDALRTSHDEQLTLLAVTDRTYAFLEEAAEDLSDEQVLSARVLLGEAETRLGRYFGM